MEAKSHMNATTKIIKFNFLFPLFFLYGCGAMPQIADDIEKIADNDAITIKCDKDCFQRDTDIHVNVDVVNKQPIATPAN
jgi:hypothetical protein